MSSQPQRPLPAVRDGEAKAASPILRPLAEAPQAAQASEGPAPWPAWVEALFPVINIIQAALLALWTIFWVPVAFAVGLVSFRRELPLAMARTIWAPPLIAMTGSRIQVEPLPQVDWSKPHIFLMNHQSMADIPAAFRAIPTNLRFVAKHSLKWVPFVGWYMAFTGMIFINRSHRREALRSLGVAGDRIREGSNILAYPEGTRSRDGSILPFKKGPFMLALAARVPIIPVAVEGTRRVCPRDGFKLRPALIRVKLGEPIETASLKTSDRDELMRRTRDEIIRLHREIGGKGGAGGAIAAAGVEGRE